MRDNEKRNKNDYLHNLYICFEITTAKKGSFFNMNSNNKKNESPSHVIKYMQMVMFLYNKFQYTFEFKKFTSDTT